jgi:hypothetical protein
LRQGLSMVAQASLEFAMYKLSSNS